jgi:hypothetical protein
MSLVKGRAGMKGRAGIASRQPARRRLRYDFQELSKVQPAVSYFVLQGGSQLIDVASGDIDRHPVL